MEILGYILVGSLIIGTIWLVRLMIKQYKDELENYRNGDNHS